ncbi:DNA repair protein RecO [Candidatus Campbellbacteria bacterium RIFOXYC2_FULL_35_25]|uniref:DNA repair protein RecO n=1 Tax=Candidatus Campbellbacteria bacterium RIFOXYC2_FULL_35_25 TaxID=1797582 RepID=A0A1F5EIP2_9BACT|nr:MAG: DNA repair protein RecO [Candidatus Campbellbacteria bacterium RIFOXYC2_FULL_35_25]
MHNIYTTQGIVLNSFDTGESNKFFYLFTRELGLINATAQGVRKISSKNRYGLQDFSISDISLVRGKDIWRITNVSPIENLFFIFSGQGIRENKRFDFILSIFSLLRKLIHGEEKNEELFDIVSDTVNFLKERDLSKKELENLGLITNIKILNNLGYFDKNVSKELFSDFLSSRELSNKLILKMETVKKEAQKMIGEIFEEMHL